MWQTMTFQKSVIDKSKENGVLRLGSETHCITVCLPHLTWNIKEISQWERLMDSTVVNSQNLTSVLELSIIYESMTFCIRVPTLKENLV